ncbi:MAG: NUDIX domain-containing protein [Ruminococcus sp.]|nr:NUDIX domain-containing protein [Ruminococcus sp.]
MERIIRIDLKDYDEAWTRFRRPSVRAVIVRDSKVAMVYSAKYDYYKFPGGGIEADESHKQTLIREVSEETGLSIVPESIAELGSVLRVQKSRTNENEIFEQENFYYTCNVENSVSAQSLDEYELEEGFRLEYVSPEKAIEVNRTHDHSDYDAMLIEREALVLEYLLDKRIL